MTMTHDKICINIPVADLDRSIQFYQRFGFEKHPVFGGPDCQCMIITDHIHIMMHLAASLQQFTPKQVADPSAVTGAVLSLDCDSRQRVDDFVATAIAHGGAAYDAAQDLGFIYTHGFTDPDGNVWRFNHFNTDIPLPCHD